MNKKKSLKGITRMKIANELHEVYKDVSLTKIDKILRSFFIRVYRHLKNNDEIHLRGFGTLKLVKRKAIKDRTIHLPSVNRKISKPERFVPKMKFSTAYKNINIKE